MLSTTVSPSPSAAMITPNDHRQDCEFSSTPSSIAVAYFGEAAQMNNDGITALCNGKEDHAIELLTNSIRLMKSGLTKPNRRVENIKNTSSDEFEMKTVDEQQSSSWSGFIQTEMVPLSSSSLCPTKDSGDDDILLDLLFNEAISIPTNAHHLDDLDVHVYSAVTVFNLALAHQQKAQSMRRQAMATAETQSNYSLNMRKAEKLYQVILKLLSDHIVCRSPTGLVVMLAAINNISSIRLLMMASGLEGGSSSGMDGYEQAQQIQNALGAFVSRNSTVLRDLMEHDPTIQKLLVNVLFFKAPKVAAAA
jgi:hypothetical protein